MTPLTEMVRPHDLRDGDRIILAGQVATVTTAPLPSMRGGTHHMVAVTDRGSVSWTLGDARWPIVERVADRRA